MNVKNNGDKCDKCNHGYIFAIDKSRPGDYEYVFRCECKSEPAAYSVWSEEFEKRGFVKVNK